MANVEVVTWSGRAAVRKHRPGAPPGFFAAEALGLEWLRAADAVRLPEVLAHDDVSITLEQVTSGRPSAPGAEAFGRALADLHRSGADAFGAPWPGFIGDLGADNRPAQSWVDFYRGRRVLPYLRAAHARHIVSDDDVRVIDAVLGRLDELAGPAITPHRIHGDLWSGNLLWDGAGQAWLIDPAAHGGHRESDLAMLALFGAPELDRVVAAYDEAWPLEAGWRERVALHQLHPLLVHAVLFGASYGRQAVEAAAGYR